MTTKEIAGLIYSQVHVMASKNLLIPFTFNTQKCFPKNSDDSLWLGYFVSWDLQS